MVKAILKGNKIQTRRPIIIQPDEDGLSFDLDVKGWHDTSGKNYTCPFHKRGLSYKDSILWVKETYSPNHSIHVSNQGLLYKATDTTKETWHGKWCSFKDGKWLDHYDRPMKWTPSIHMPKWASRITLKVKKVWVERIQDISDDEAKSEGVEQYKDPCPDSILNKAFEHAGLSVAKYKPSFSFLWDEIYAGQGLGWDQNPWVWACEFEVVK